MNNQQAIKILKEEKSWESDDRKIDAFNMGIEALEEQITICEKIEACAGNINNIVKTI